MKKLSIKFQLRKSYGLCLILLFIHVGALFCICLIPLPAWGKLAITACILANLIIVIRTYALLNSTRAVIEFWHSSNGDWYLKKRSGHIEPTSIEFPIFISGCLIVLKFIPRGLPREQGHGGLTSGKKRKLTPLGQARGSYPGRSLTLIFAPVKKFSKISVPIAKDAFLVADDFRKLKVLLKTALD